MRELDRFRCVSCTSPGWEHPGALFHDRLVDAGVHSDLHMGGNLNHIYPILPSPEGHRARHEIIRIISGRRDSREPMPPAEAPGPAQIDQTGIAFTVSVTG